MTASNTGLAIKALQLVYRKFYLNDRTIDRDELGGMLHVQMEALMGRAAFLDWVGSAVREIHGGVIHMPEETGEAPR